VRHASALGVLLRSLIVEREPIYRQQETAHGFVQGLFGLSAEEMARLTDDRIGRALDRLFDADRAALLTDVVLAVGREFALRFDEVHNDSTSVSFCGQYRAAARRALRGRTAPAITYGFSKDHGPDLKQLIFILTLANDGGVPVQFRCADGNANDSQTHIETWNALRNVAGRTDFLYVANSKLCSRDNMDYIHRAGGRFVTVMPRSRLEDAEFRKWIQTHNAILGASLGSAESALSRWAARLLVRPQGRAPLRAGVERGLGVEHALLTLRQESHRRRNIAAATEQLRDLRQRLLSARARLRGAAQIDLKVAEILEHYPVGRYLKVRRVAREEHVYRQAQRGRPGPETAYRKIPRRRYDIEWSLDKDGIAYDQKGDGISAAFQPPQSIAGSDPCGPQRPTGDREALRAD
jgi:hypothetical protein